MKKAIPAILAAVALAAGTAVFPLSVFAAGEYDVNIPAANIYSDCDSTAVCGDPIPSDSTVYIRAADVAAGMNAPGIYNGAFRGNGRVLADSDFFKVKFQKGDNNPKLIKKMSLVEKADLGVPGSSREWWIKIEIAEFYTDEEYKLTPSILFTATEEENWPDAMGVPFGDKIYANVPLFVKNTVKNADADTDNGVGGTVIAPQKDDQNEIVWNDETGEVARLSFMGDSDVDKFYSKLSTKWRNDVYEEMFKNQNAFKFEFVAQPTISSTSRATLELYNPYMNDDGDETVDPSTITIYQVTADGGLLDVTGQFTYGVNENDNAVFSTQTRTLGYYIMAEEPIAGAGEEPGEETEQNGDAGFEMEEVEKVNPSTGSY